MEKTTTIEVNKTRDLILSLVFDTFGYASYSIPFLMEWVDIFWAPIAGFCFARLYKGTLGTFGGIATFIEELLPFTDFVPTFTLAWVYKYVLKK